jgi:hypothetical protein
MMVPSTGKSSLKRPTDSSPVGKAATRRKTTEALVTDDERMDEQTLNIAGKLKIVLGDIDDPDRDVENAHLLPLLNAIISGSNGVLDKAYLDPQRAFELLDTQPGLAKALVKAFKEKKFGIIRTLGAFELS